VKSLALAAGFPFSILGKGIIVDLNQYLAIASMSDGTANNYADCHYNTTRNLSATALVGGVTVGAVATANAATNMAMATGACRIGVADYVSVLNGGTVVTANTAGAMPAITIISIGSLGAGTGPINGYQTLVEIWAGPSNQPSNAALQVFTR
jgi:hypothetical protein